MGLDCSVRRVREGSNDDGMSTVFGYSFPFLRALVLHTLDAGYPRRARLSVGIGREPKATPSSVFPASSSLTGVPRTTWIGTGVATMVCNRWCGGGCAYSAGQHEGRMPKQRQQVKTFCARDSPSSPSLPLPRPPSPPSPRPPPQSRVQHADSHAHPTKEQPQTPNQARHGISRPKHVYLAGAVLVGF